MLILSLPDAVTDVENNLDQKEHATVSSVTIKSTNPDTEVQNQEKFNQFGLHFQYNSNIELHLTATYTIPFYPTDFQLKCKFLIAYTQEASKK